MIESVDIKGGEAGRTEVLVRLAGGKSLTLYAATPEAAAQWVAPQGFCAGPPVLYVKSLEPAAVREAVEVMAADLSGYWLRYYGSAARQPRAGAGEEGGK
ncbi:MAG: hypothetical protein NTX64_18560 [Elusimicrobia bacterium]|nr:hypothetical protein [Elusimicrobiota bacterium]